ncbi:transposon Tf2-8 polyprotein [Trichonephila clavipes]|nr:transposon Tf2-8 polyprotein [Trichonephila clavipes]
MSQIEALPVTSKELRQETSKDIELGPLLRALREGKDLQGREAQYTIEDGCIMNSKMKVIARSFVYWKNIDNDIEEAAKNCVDCARYKADPPKSKVHYWEYPNKLRRDNFEFRDRKFDVGDRVAVRVYRAANTRWKFGTIVNQDGVLHYIIDVQGTLVRRHVDQIRPVGIKCKKTSFHLCTRDFIIRGSNKELGSSSVQGVPSTDVAVPDLSQSSAKETDSETRSPPVPDRPFPRRSGRIRRPPERLVL